MNYSILIPTRVFDEGHIKLMGPLGFSIWVYLHPSVNGRTRSQDFNDIGKTLGIAPWTAMAQVKTLHRKGYLMKEEGRYRPILPSRVYR